MDVESLAKQVWAMQSKPDAVDFAAYSLQSDIRENLKRIYCHAKRVAKLQAHVDNAAAWTNRTSTEVQNEPQLAQVPAEAQA